MEGLSDPRPLTSGDDRIAFDCGVAALNNWFHRHSWRNQEDSTSRTSVICDAVHGDVVGYVSLCATQIERAHLPKSDRRNRPDPMPALLLGQLAIDQGHQGRGHGRDLLQFALLVAVRISHEIGCFGVITHPINEQVRTFYQRSGFEVLPFDPRRSMIIRIADLEVSDFVA